MARLAARALRCARRCTTHRRSQNYRGQVIGFTLGEEIVDLRSAGLVSGNQRRHHLRHTVNRAAVVE